MGRKPGKEEDVLGGLVHSYTTQIRRGAWFPGSWNFQWCTASKNRVENYAQPLLPDLSGLTWEVLQERVVGTEIRTVDFRLNKES